ncbi:MAG: TetR/AcrR family transcriptional regulator [Rhodoferax sp.]|nr:TetR/AcrR family transcriptional regulator [Rhodoferax sp.]
MQLTVTRLPTEARRAEIVAAAVRLAQERSPASITTTDLASAVGLSQGALFKHFPSKEAVWLAVMTWVAEHLLRSLNEAAQQAATPLDALQSVFDAHVEFVVTFPGVPRVIFHELQQPLDSPVKRQVRDLLQGYRQLLLHLLQAAVRRGDVPADLDAPAAATLFVGIVQGLVMQSMLSGQISTMRVEAPRVFHLYLRGIRPLP